MSEQSKETRLQRSATLQCRSCELGFGLKRLILNTDTDEQFGSLCFTCETKLEGVASCDEPTAETSTCVRCGEDGPYAVPELHVSVGGGTDEEFEYEYDLTEETPRFCERHLREFVQRSRQTDPHGYLDGDF